MHSIPGGLAFGAALLLLTAALGFQRPRPAWSQLAWGGGGAAVLCLPPLLNRLGGDDVLAPPGVWPTWAAMVTLVAIAEELFLGALRWVSGSVTARHDPCAGQSRRMVAAMNRQITTLLTAPPTVASGTARVTGGAAGPVGATSAEQGPQVEVVLDREALTAPREAKKVRVRVRALAPSSQPRDGTVWGNVYRVTATSDNGPVRLRREGASSITLRAPADQPRPVVQYRDRSGWHRLITTKFGHDRYKAAVPVLGDSRAALEVTSPDGWAWATAEGTATLVGPGTDPHGPEVQALVDYYRAAAGEHPDWEEYRSVMVADRRVLISMTVDKVYGAKIR